MEETQHFARVDTETAKDCEGVFVEMPLCLILINNTALRSHQTFPVTMSKCFANYNPQKKKTYFYLIVASQTRLCLR